MEQRAQRADVGPHQGLDSWVLERHRRGIDGHPGRRYLKLIAEEQQESQPLVGRQLLWRERAADDGCIKLAAL